MLHERLVIYSAIKQM